jgi:hypothetical protein
MAFNITITADAEEQLRSLAVRDQRAFERQSRPGYATSPLRNHLKS